MTSKEWVKNELSLSDDCLTPTDRVMLSKVLQDLDRLEEFEKVLNGHCSKCVNRENNICVGMDAPIHIDTLINCIEMLSTELQMENQELKNTNMKYAKLIDDFQAKNMRLEKILSVILKKRIDLESFYSTFVKDDLDYKYYEKYYGTYGLEKLTQEEFELLKKVFYEMV